MQSTYFANIHTNTSVQHLWCRTSKALDRPAIEIKDLIQPPPKKNPTNAHKIINLIFICSYAPSCHKGIET